MDASNYSLPGRGGIAAIAAQSLSEVMIAPRVVVISSFGVAASWPFAPSCGRSSPLTQSEARKSVVEISRAVFGSGPRQADRAHEQAHAGFLPREDVADGGARMAAQNRRQILMDDEARPDQAVETEHEGKQPHDPRRWRLVGEDDVEAGEVDLCLLTGRGLGADFLAAFPRGRGNAPPTALCS